MDNIDNSNKNNKDNILSFIDYLCSFSECNCVLLSSTPLDSIPFHSCSVLFCSVLSCFILLSVLTSEQYILWPLRCKNTALYQMQKQMPGLIHWATLSLSILGKNFSKQHWNTFLIFPWKQVLKFHANCLHWSVKSCFLRKYLTTLSSVEFAHRVVKV